ncbi:MAG: endopeptidase La [bacterium]
MEEKRNIPKDLPIFPTREVVIYPAMIVPLLVGRDENIKLIDDASVGDRIIGLFAQRDGEKEKISEDDIYRVGTAGQILKMLKLPDGTAQLLVQGLSRIKLKRVFQDEPYLKGTVEEIFIEESEGIETEAMRRNLLDLLKRVVSLSPRIPQEFYISALNLKHPGNLADLVVANLNLEVKEQQEFLETMDPKKRLERATLLLTKELDLLEIGSKIQSEIRTRIDKNQREYFLRQQLEAINKELGQEDEQAIEIKELAQKIEAAKMLEEVEKEAKKELDRLGKIPPAAAEYTVARTYLDWLINLPWAITTEDRLDLPEAARVLEEDHYNLEKVKERILEYLAVRSLKKDMKGPILCFVGPPGVGKTSLGRSIARALGRKFVRISLGGIRDEAEIRGHRRTYIGALPGRIIQGIKRAGSRNPVFMMDEVDKIGADFRGDPSAALLEVLDPEQNNAFSDHYIDLPFDLSQVMFITTANIVDPIPSALRDRMETLDLPGYTEEEKLAIAQKFLVPRQLAEHGLKEEDLSFEPEALSRISREYTREAGLRNLEREIATICRKVARKIAEGKEGGKKIRTADVPKFLGPLKFFLEVAERRLEPGVVIGLAWTQTGGDILFIEAARMKGKKGLTLTGQLGEVMQESARAALTYVRTRAKNLGIAENFFEHTDIHIHVPAGAIPKDGPSAGVSIAAALASLLSNRPSRPFVAMTGEATLRGQVLPVGGIKEKILAARRAGIKTVILPKKNEKDLIDIPEHVKKELEFIGVETIDEVIEQALERG